MPDAPTDTSKVPSTPLGSPLPSLLANLAASEGSSLIHDSERRLNQPVMGGEHGGVSALRRFLESRNSSTNRNGLSSAGGVPGSAPALVNFTSRKANANI